ncbi:MurR/RpiR family transcriptional regulator [Faecalicoccus pleomorphus]|uniref:MurR/RpiR family transcriptional regulator n=1 Tax=Faecalicoccus pleomorphus TaxID=1323 RepID=UPI00142FC544|nr:MurR/RpiR family transcriptional regulator [Faecalicoccus pleomorphus]NJE40087.1 MurR/RpiR family transcriptional regulator [Faecalicoccus pleomorphus]
MTLEKRIQTCKHLTPAETEIAHYILTHAQDVIHMSLQDLSNTLYFSKSAIHRFCKKIGCTGFNDVKVQLSQDLSNHRLTQHDIDVNYPFTKSDLPLDIAEKLARLYETSVRDTIACLEPSILQNVASLMFHAQKIDIYTHAHNMHVARNFQDQMLTIGKEINCPASFYEQRLYALASNKKHVALILSYSGKASFILPILKQLDEKQVPTILISRIGCNSYPQYITYHLALSDTEQLQDRISQYASHIALQYVMDVLFGCIYNLDRENNQNYVWKSMNFMDDRLD